ncbi:MAG: VOC family protein [Anaerolineae bacterium]
MRRFGGVSLITSNVTRLRNFYRVVLQLEPEGDSVHSAFPTAGAALTLYSVQGMEEMAPGSTVGIGSGSTVLGFEVADVDVEYERLQSLRLEILKPPATYPWGTRSVWLRDPDGNVVNLYAFVQS